MKGEIVKRCEYCNTVIEEPRPFQRFCKDYCFVQKAVQIQREEAERRWNESRERMLFEALAELVELKDVVKHQDPDDYEKRKPLAWQKAREAIEAVRGEGVG